MWVLWLYVVISLLPGAASESDNRQIKCFKNGKPIELPSPFPTRERQDKKFACLVWLFFKKGKDGAPAEESQVLVIDKNNVTAKSDRYKVFQTWGLQVNNATPNDAGRYTAALHSSNAKKEQRIFIFEVVVRPKLMSTQLTVNKINSHQGFTLNCGTVGNLGSPPVMLVWRANNGTVFNGRFKHGELSISLNKQEDITGFTCELDNTSSPATKCIHNHGLWTARFHLITAGNIPDQGEVTHWALVSGTLAITLIASAVGAFFYNKVIVQSSPSTDRMDSIMSLSFPIFRRRSSGPAAGARDSQSPSAATSVISYWGYLPAECPVTDPQWQKWVDVENRKKEPVIRF